MNWLLILVVLLVAGNIVWGFFRGFLRVVYSMAAWILILVFVTFATPYVADWMTEHTGLDTRIVKNCKEKLQNAVAGEEKSTEEQNTQEQKDLSGLGMKLPANVWNQIGDTHKLADDWMEQSGLYNTIASKASSLAMKAIAFVIVILITVIAIHLIATAIDLVAKLPVIGEVNHMLGGIAGLIKGLLLVWLVFAFAAMGAATEAGSVVSDAGYQADILQWLYEKNLILTILLSFL